MAKVLVIDPVWRARAIRHLEFLEGLADNTMSSAASLMLVTISGNPSLTGFTELQRQLKKSGQFDIEAAVKELACVLNDLSEQPPLITR